MVAFNLLAWRGKQKQFEKNRLYGTLGLAVLFAVLLMSVAHVAVMSRLSRLKEQVGVLQTRMRTLTMATEEWLAAKKRYDDANMLAVALRDYQAVMESVFVELGRAPLENVCFTDITREKNVITFTGYTRSIVDLTDFLLHWRIGDLFAAIKIDHLRGQPSDHYMRFRYHAIEKNTFALKLLNENSVDKDAV